LEKNTISNVALLNRLQHAHSQHQLSLWYNCSATQYLTSSSFHFDLQWYCCVTKQEVGWRYCCN